MSMWLFFGFFYNHFMHEICCDLSVLVVTSCVYSLHWSILGLTRFMLAVCTSNPPAIVNNAGWSGSRVALGNCQEGGEGLAAHSLAAHLNSCPPVPSSRPTAHHLRPTNAHQPPTKFKPGTPGTRAHGQNTAADDFLWNERLVWGAENLKTTCPGSRSGNMWTPVLTLGWRMTLEELGGDLETVGWLKERGHKFEMEFTKRTSSVTEVKDLSPCFRVHGEPEWSVSLCIKN